METTSRTSTETNGFEKLESVLKELTSEASLEGFFAWLKMKMEALPDSSGDEMKLLEMLDSLDLWSCSRGSFWEGEASELEEMLIDKYGPLAKRLLSSSAACGMFLRLLRMQTDRVESRICCGRTIWTILPPQSCDQINGAVEK